MLLEHLASLYPIPVINHKIIYRLQCLHGPIKHQFIHLTRNHMYHIKWKQEHYYFFTFGYVNMNFNWLYPIKSIHHRLSEVTWSDRFIIKQTNKSIRFHCAVSANRIQIILACFPTGLRAISPSITDLGLVSNICVMKNSSHFLSDEQVAYHNWKSLFRYDVKLHRGHAKLYRPFQPTQPCTSILGQHSPFGLTGN